MDSTVVAMPGVADQINFWMPILMGAAMFLITQVTKNIVAFKNFKPDYILWPLALAGTFGLAYFYQPDMTVKQVWDTATFFVGTAGAIHLGKKLIWDGAIRLFQMFNK